MMSFAPEMRVLARRVGLATALLLTAAVLPAVRLHAADGTAAPSPAPALTADPSLQRRVSGEFASEPLPTVLARLSQLGGVALAQNKDADLQGARVTAYFKDLPLHQVMQSLAGLYAASWVKEENRYVLTHAAQGAQRALVRTGDPDWFRVLVGFDEYQERKAAAQEAVAALAPHQRLLLASEGGLPIAQIPEAQRQRLRQAVQAAAVVMDVANYRQTQPDIIGRAVVQVSTPERAVGGVKPEPLLSITSGTVGVQGLVWELPLPPPPPKPAPAPAGRK